jgi:hypothetical protein
MNCLVIYSFFNDALGNSGCIAATDMEIANDESPITVAARCKARNVSVCVYFVFVLGSFLVSS